jgi:hypothetical protein
MGRAPTASFADRPCPVLTPAQRFHLDTFGFVVVPNTLTTSETARLRGELHQLRDELLTAAGGVLPAGAPGGLGSHRVRGASLSGSSHRLGLTNLIEAGGAITGYSCHPVLVSMAEELLGAEARILEHNAIINRREESERDACSPAAESYRWHRGATPGEASHERGGLLHCNFVKTLTNLTELGPEDGGVRENGPASAVLTASTRLILLLPQTVLIAGSHRMTQQCA